MTTFWFFFFLFPSFAFSGDSCPEYITCETSETPTRCPAGKYYREKVKVHGCCPGCMSLKGEGETCEVSTECEPGLKCHPNTCIGDRDQACEYYKRFDPILKRTKYWEPNCLPDGSYAPKQCKGEKMAGKCFCVNRAGVRIFGEVEWSKAENMTCACSRLVEETKTAERTPHLHCDALGNFEPLQCDGKVCWCANPRTGIPYTVMVPPDMMISLPCYKREAVGAQYYRQCDSANRMREAVNALLRNHGTTGIYLVSHLCNPDGSFHRVQIFREKKRCAYLNNAPLTELVKSDQTPTCNCAYDRHVAEMSQTNFWLDCAPNGNYVQRQIWNESVICIDQDGFYCSDDPNDCPV